MTDMDIGLKAIGGWRAGALAAAILAYGAFSAPAPPGLRPQEMLIFAGLILFIGWRGPLLLASGLSLFSRLSGPTLAFRLASLVLVFLLWLGVLRGLWNGWGVTDMARDILPFLFLSLPVLLAPGLSRLSPAQFTRMVDCAGWAGCALALRWWVGAGLTLSALGSTSLGEGKDYLLNSALVPFAGVWLCLRALSRPGGDAGRLWRLGLPLLYGVGGLACLLALAATIHRAALGLSLLAILLGLWRVLARRPLFALLLGGGLVVLVVVAGVPLAGVAGLVAAKTESVGMNNRVGEVLAVLDQVGRDPLAFVIGDGWGALVANPAVGYWRVSYTHSALSYFLLKAGLLGLIGMALYAGALAGQVLRRLSLQPMLFLAALPPLLIGSFLHTSFKYICFSIILSLVVSTPEIPFTRE
ncbi:hypothetical protein GE253_01585 [Niveispirillum sp. SYP-B3756]|uniref:hypothetical protein n=1 Tax=Niveispirillum sp. SYP-B3756 TaxID=2662178 RepID=UPI0012918D0D|nr:hypothetical protein [Niveispirillum sp. SYP-B3756]MQP64026.1 hypothetical protein [Niveispirillum sp. SYP-B3756]